MLLDRIGRTQAQERGTDIQAKHRTEEGAEQTIQQTGEPWDARAAGTALLVANLTAQCTFSAHLSPARPAGQPVSTTWVGCSHHRRTALSIGGQQRHLPLCHWPLQLQAALGPQVARALKGGGASAAAAPLEHQVLNQRLDRGRVGWDGRGWERGDDGASAWNL